MVSLPFSFSLTSSLKTSSHFSIQTKSLFGMAFLSRVANMKSQKQFMQQGPVVQSMVASHIFSIKNIGKFEVLRFEILTKC